MYYYYLNSCRILLSSSTRQQELSLCTVIMKTDKHLSIYQLFYSKNSTNSSRATTMCPMTDDYYRLTDVDTTNSFCVLLNFVFYCYYCCCYAFINDKCALTATRLGKGLTQVFCFFFCKKNFFSHATIFHATHRVHCN